MIKSKHLAPFQLLPSQSGVCPECAVDHAECEPHNQQSLAYRYHFYNEHGRWPNWGDAIAHCSDEVQGVWRSALIEKGVSEIELIPGR